MLGAIAGDIAGSPWENGQCADGDFTLFGEDCIFTDDTVLTIGIADALLDGKSFATTLRQWAARYPGRGYGGGFIDWVYTPDKGPYGSLMNGAAMRVSATAWLADDLDDCLSLARASAAITHDHPEGVVGARAIAAAVWLGRQGVRGPALLEALKPHVPYDLSVQPWNLAWATTHARESVPVAIIAAAHTDSWEDAVRLTCQIGGDCDTTSCMAGAIAEACYGLPPEIARAAIAYLPPEMFAVLSDVYAAADCDPPWASPAITDRSVTPWAERIRSWFRRPKI